MINSEFLFLWLLCVPLDLTLLSLQHLTVLLNGNEYKFRENATVMGKRMLKASSWVSETVTILLSYANL